MILYYFPSCPYCVRVLTVLDELNIAVELRDVKKNKDYGEDLKKLTGSYQVPCLVSDNVPMLESAEIIKFLKLKYS